MSDPAHGLEAPSAWVQRWSHLVRPGGSRNLHGETWLVLTPPLVARPEADAPPAADSGSARPEGSQP